MRSEKVLKLIHVHLSMSVVHSPFTHVPNNHHSLFRNRVHYSSTFPPPITLDRLSKEPIPKLTFAYSTSIPSIVVEHGTHNVVVSSNEQDLKEESEFFDENEQHLKEEDEFFEAKERTRRTRIGHGNKGKVPWNKGRNHTEETREKIRIRTLEALRDPKVKNKMTGHTRAHSDRIKEKISYSQRCVWHERLKSKRARELVFLLWKQNIANAAMKGGSDQEELDWDSYDKINEQLELQQISQAEAKGKEKLMAIAGAKKLIQSWKENIAKAAKEGGSGEQELDWDSCWKIKEEMFLLNKLQRASEKAKAKEMAKIKAKKEAEIRAIKRVILTQKKRDLRERTKARENKKSRPYKNTKQHKHALEATHEFKLGSKLTKNRVSNNISSEVAEKGDTMDSNFPIDLELIRKEEMQKNVSLAEQIKAAKLLKGKKLK